MLTELTVFFSLARLLIRTRDREIARSTLNNESRYAARCHSASAHVHNGCLRPGCARPGPVPYEFVPYLRLAKTSHKCI